MPRGRTPTERSKYYYESIEPSDEKADKRLNSMNAERARVRSDTLKDLSYKSHKLKGKVQTSKPGGLLATARKNVALLSGRAEAAVPMSERLKGRRKSTNVVHAIPGASSTPRKRPHQKYRIPKE